MKMNAEHKFNTECKYQGEKLLDSEKAMVARTLFKKGGIIGLMRGVKLV